MSKEEKAYVDAYHKFVVAWTGLARQLQSPPGSGVYKGAASMMLSVMDHLVERLEMMGPL